MGSSVSGSVPPGDGTFDLPGKDLFIRTHRRRVPDTCAIFVHAGAGYHSVQNESMHLQACTDAAKAAMTVLRAGGSAVDGVEMAIKVLEDREITNAGYGSNLAADGTVECDASVVDHWGRSGAVGAVSQIRNPISLARLVLEHSTKPLLLRRVPPNLLVGPGATDFAFEMGVPVLPYDDLVSPSSRVRWIKWKADLLEAERQEAERQEAEFVKESSPISFAELNQEAEDRMKRKQREQHTAAMEGHGVPYARKRFKEDNLSSLSRPLQESAADLSPASAFPSWFAHRSITNSPSQSPQISLGSTGENPPSDRAVQGSDRGDQDQELAAMETLQGLGIKSKILGRNDGSEDSTPLISDGPSSNTLQLPSISPSPLPFAAIYTPPPPSPSPDSTSNQPPAGSSSILLSRISGPQYADNLHSRLPIDDDIITDTVGAIAVDSQGNIAAGSSSGGIGMKRRGRTGPAALVGVGTAVVPVDSEDPEKTTVAAVTSGTGEHMATTLAASVGAERLYSSVRKGTGGVLEEVTEDVAIQAFVEKEFMAHPSVRYSNSPGAIGLMAVKKTRDGLWLYFAHNTDSFAVASMSFEEAKPVCVMSRSHTTGKVCQGGRSIKARRRH